MRENWKVNAAIAAISGLAWVAAYLLNARYMSYFVMTPGIDYLFIPSGVRLMAIMIGGIWAAVGVAVGGLFLTGPEFQTMQPGVIMAIALGGGLFPYVALRASLRATAVEPNLRNLTARKLPLISLGVSLGSAVLHNLLFGVLGLKPWSGFASRVLAMATGDFLGILLAVILVFVVLRLVRSSAV